jgi:hypothetical protein
MLNFFAVSVTLFTPVDVCPHASFDEHSSVLGCTDVLISNLLTFRRNLVLPSSGYKLSTAYSAPERGDSKLPQNVLWYSSYLSCTTGADVLGGRLVRPVVTGGQACSWNRASSVTSWQSDRLTYGNDDDDDDNDDDGFGYHQSSKFFESTE